MKDPLLKFLRLFPKIRRESFLAWVLSNPPIEAPDIVCRLFLCSASSLPGFCSSVPGVAARRRDREADRNPFYYTR